MATLRHIESNKYLVTFQDPQLNKQRKRLIAGKTEAKKFFAKVENIIEADYLGIDIPRKFSNKYTLGELLKDFIVHAENNLSKSTKVRYETALNNLVKSESATTFVEKANIEHFKQNNLYRQKNGVNADLRAIKSAFSWAKKMGKISEEPPVIYYKIAKKKINILSDDEIRILLNNAKGDTHNLLRFYLLTGARRSEPLQGNFTWQDVDFQNNRIAMRRKGNRKSWVSVSQDVMDILYNWMDRDAPIPYTENYVRNRFNELRESTGIQFTTHDLRRASGAILLRQGSSIFHVSKFLDHSSVDITVKYYVDLLSEEKRELYDSVARHLESIVTES